jgi:hypothetical protein
MQTLPMEACYLLFLEIIVYTVPYHLQNPVLFIISSNVGDPDLDLQDPHVFGPPGSNPLLRYPFS